MAGDDLAPLLGELSERLRDEELGDEGDDAEPIFVGFDLLLAKALELGDEAASDAEDDLDLNTADVVLSEEGEGCAELKLVVAVAVVFGGVDIAEGVDDAEDEEFVAFGPQLKPVGGAGAGAGVFALAGEDLDGDAVANEDVVDVLVGVLLPELGAEKGTFDIMVFDGEVGPVDFCGVSFFLGVVDEEEEDEDGFLLALLPLVPLPPVAAARSLLENALASAASIKYIPL
jgi:hypothetical protein